MDDLVDSSGLAPRTSMEQEVTSTFVETESKPTEWTNEKHSNFLKAMESTFVDQLYKSLDLSGFHSYKNSLTGPKSSKHKLNSIRASSGQFKVLRDGNWSKLDFRGKEPEVGEQEESKAPLTSPWIHHYRNSKTPMNRKVLDSAKAPLMDSENQNRAVNFQLRHDDSVGGNTEMSGQNFADEAPEEEKSRRMHDTKIPMTNTDTDCNNDQVVPFGNSVQDNDFGDNPVLGLPEE
ncbi:hypothetical protein CASFOL_038242 [Castilleja foliolosa]|uniref:Uncharacterized protein n=1 Tax=Castilleja foliolosa TaxID=1961234 RepID=A0ABD3BLN4_9LAMI